MEAETLVDLLAFKLAEDVANALLHRAPDTLKEANHERLRKTVVNVKAKSPIDTLADTIAEASERTLDNTLADVDAVALVETPADTQT